MKTNINMTLANDLADHNKTLLKMCEKVCPFIKKESVLPFQTN